MGAGVDGNSGVNGATYTDGSGGRRVRVDCDIATDGNQPRNGDRTTNEKKRKKNKEFEPLDTAISSTCNASDRSKTNK